MKNSYPVYKNIQIKNIKDWQTGLSGELLIEDGVFVSELSAPAELVVDAQGLTALPGLIDAHVHLRDPGFEYREDIISGTKAAAHGGFTAVATMPNTNPVADTVPVICYQIEKAAAAAYCRVLPIGAATKGQAGKELAEIGLMAEAGAVAFSDDGVPIASADMMRKAMEYAAFFDRVIISHSEDPDLSKDGVCNEGIVSTEMGLKGIPSIAEDIMIDRETRIAEYLGCFVHIAHVSTAGGVGAVRAAKARGVKVTAETCPHYFTLTEEAVRGFNTYAKVNPPLRTEADRLAVIEGLKDGTLDIIVTDHAPHHEDEKNCEFSLANNGMIGLETCFPLVYTKLVEGGHLSLADAVEKLTANPAKLLKQSTPSLEVGSRADLTLVDLDEAVAYDVSTSLSKARNTPFREMELKGFPQLTIMAGNITWDSGRLVTIINNLQMI
ncbi:MAG: dihydroorotase [Clostridiaceae bacterium]|nr:dihydroorotase [Clostridiaceae bacterium]